MIDTGRSIIIRDHPLGLRGQSNNDPRFRSSDDQMHVGSGGRLWDIGKQRTSMSAMGAPDPHVQYEILRPRKIPLTLVLVLGLP
jgi:hypothetical protein